MAVRVKLIPRLWYIYVLFRLNGIPCYVGLGKGDRIDHHEKDAKRGVCGNSRLQNIIRKSGGSIPKIVIRDNLTLTEARQLEILFIQIIGRDDLNCGPLVNFTNGGESTQGYIVPKDVIEKRAAKIRGKKQSPEVIYKRTWMRRGTKHSLQAIEKIREAKQGIKYWLTPDGTCYAAFNKRHELDKQGRTAPPPASEKTRQKMRDSHHKFRWWTTLSNESYTAKDPRSLSDKLGRKKLGTRQPQGDQQK